MASGKTPEHDGQRICQRICMWSGPRNLSTAMMRSFENRADCAVWDEPFFAPYLAITGKEHPGRLETLAAHETDPDLVAKACLALPRGGETLYFQKHMPHHMIEDMPRDWMRQCQHFFLLRDPALVIASYAKGRAEFGIDDIGFLAQAALYDEISTFQNDVPIIDSEDILAAPQSVLSQLCTRLGIAFDPDMLAWPKGPRETDGAWAPYWYHSVEQSEGFGAPRQSGAIVPERYAQMAELCRPAYERLRALRIKP